MPSARTAIGIDFGTTNTVVAVARPGVAVEPVCFDHAAERFESFVTALCFWDDRQQGLATTRVEGGPWAIERFLDASSPMRFMQSFKSFAASRTFQDTRIFRERYRFEDLLAAFLRCLLRHAGGQLDLDGARIVIGRPVTFAGGRPDEALAMERYANAFGRLGVTAADYVYEPVGAAFFYARQLEHDATVLVADFGGGTSDFSVMRFERIAGKMRATPLAHAGVGIAGDAFDRRIVDRVVSPRLGKGSLFRSFDKQLAIPNHYYANLARWHQLVMMKTNGDLKGLQDLLKVAVEPAKLQRFIDLVEFDLGFALYRAVSQAKLALSDGEEAPFHFEGEGFRIKATITRDAFERWIALDVARIAATVDEAMRVSGLRDSAIDRVFLTGGTSFVPAIRGLFSTRFGNERLVSADQFRSIAFGLALIGQEPDRERWIAPSSHKAG